MNARTLAVFLLLPLVIALERLAWYASRAGLYSLFSERFGSDELASLFARSSVGLVVAPLVVGVVGALLLPRVTLIVGGVLAACGYALLGRAETLGEVRFALDVVTLGSSAVKVSVYALAVLVLPASLRLRAAFVIGCYGLVNVASFFGTLLVGAFESQGASHPLPFLLSGVLLVATLVAAAAIAVDRLSQARGPEAPARHGRALVGALCALLVSMPAWLLLSSTQAPEVLKHAGVGDDWIGWLTTLHSVSTLAVVALGVVVFIVLLAWNDARPFPFPLLVGIGLACATAGGSVLGLTVGLGLLGAGIGLSGIVAATVLLGASEVTSPLLLARAVTGHHPRALMLVVAVWFTFPHLVWWLSGFPVVAVALGTVLAAGAVVLVLLQGRRFEAWLDEPAPPRPSNESWLSGR